MKLIIYENDLILYNNSIKEDLKVLQYIFKKDIEKKITSKIILIIGNPQFIFNFLMKINI